MGGMCKFFYRYSNKKAGRLRPDLLLAIKLL